MRIITNDNEPKKNRMEIALRDFGTGRPIDIAVAFFSHSDLLQELIGGGSTIRLVLRLNDGTSPSALRAVYGNDRIQIRFFTSPSFHPKIYVIADAKAYVGSANLTKAGQLTNQEAIAEFECDEPLYDALQDEFEKYWQTAEPLRLEHINAFQKIVAERTSHNVDPTHFVEETIGRYRYNNVGARVSVAADDRHLSDFRRRYQEYIGAFRRLLTMYERTNERRYPEIPLRIEVDRYLWWIRETHATGESYNVREVRADPEIESIVGNTVPEFMAYSSPYLDEDAVARLEAVTQAFGSSEKIRNAEIEDIYQTLLNVHAFHDRLRFYSGGLPAMKAAFLGDNKEGRIKSTLAYLLHGDQEPYDVRIARCVRDKDLKLEHFGESCAKELFGVANAEEVPICNGRTLKSMQWLGFGRL